MFWRCSVECNSVVGRFRNVATVALVDVLLRKVNLVVLCMLWGEKTVAILLLAFSVVNVTSEISKDETRWLLIGETSY
jgi:hypothetical protein